MRANRAASDSHASDLAAAQAELAAKEAQLRTILETVPVGIVMAELPSGRILEGNAYVEQMIGHPVYKSPDIDSYDEWVGYHADGTRVDGHEYPLARMVREGAEAPEIEVLYMRGDGQHAWMRIMGRPIRDAGGALVGGVVALVDIDAQRRAEQQLRDANRELEVRVAARTAELEATSELFATAFDHAPIGMTLVALDGTFLKVNPAFGEIVGYAPEELEGMTFHALTHPEDLDADASMLAQLNAGRIPSYRVEKRHIRKDGSSVWIDLSVSIVRQADGAPKHYVAQVQDLTAHKLAQDNLHEAVTAAEQGNQAKSNFLAVMSHEIRTPLNGVLGMTQAMAADELSEIQRERLGVIRESGESLLAILNDVLDLSKIEAGRLELEQREFSVGELARGAHSAFTALANKKGLSFDLSIHAAARGLYLGDSTRVRQILYNLISNALKFTHDGHVQVQVSRLARGLRFKVRDTGVGIAHDRIGSLFQRFEQADASTTRRFGGTGLGLAICRELAELMGGCIRAESELGKGSVFVVDLPLERLGDEPPLPALASPAQPEAVERADRPLRVLAAEDNSVNQLVLKTILHQIGLEPVIVANGVEAVDAWRREAWDLILMDIQMPELDGPGAVAEIRRLEAETGRRRTPVVALTANAMSHQMKQYLASGMDSFVAKPIEIHKLYAVMESLLAEP